jgi:hypothetical protein
MVITVQQAADNFGKVVKDLQNNYNGELMVKVAITGFTLLRKRVQETGVDANGQKYAPYSTKPILVGSKTFIQKAAGDKLLGSKPKRKELKWRTINGHRLAILKGGYKKVRELQGRQTDHVDFSVTNNMWNNIMAQKPTEKDLLSSHADHCRGIAIIGAKQDIEKKKLAGNTKRRGDILDLSQSEIEQLKKSYNIDVLQIFRNNGL